jgi:hypothetical protein
VLTRVRALPAFARLIWVSEPDWIRVRDILELGEEVTVRVREVRDPVRFRFPLELECVSPDVSQLLSRPPPDYPPINLYDDEDIFQAAVRAVAGGARGAASGAL